MLLGLLTLGVSAQPAEAKEKEKTVGGKPSLHPPLAVQKYKQNPSPHLLKLGQIQLSVTCTEGAWVTS